jgi:hypothetical protein
MPMLACWSLQLNLRSIAQDQRIRQGEICSWSGSQWCWAGQLLLAIGLGRGCCAVEGMCSRSCLCVLCSACMAELRPCQAEQETQDHLRACQPDRPLLQAYCIMGKPAFSMLSPVMTPCTLSQPHTKACQACHDTCKGPTTRLVCCECGSAGLGCLFGPVPCSTWCQGHCFSQE